MALTLLPIGLRLLAAAVILTLNWLRPGFGVTWMIAVGSALLAWVGLLALRLRLPVQAVLVDYQPAVLFAWSPAIAVDEVSWAYALSLVTMLLAVLLTAAGRLRSHTNPVAWAGSLTPRKNVAALIEVVRAADPDIRFDVVGDGPFGPELAELAKVHPNLSVHGQLPRPRVMEILQAADVILLTSLSEANTAILFEGLENGCIPIAPAINGFVSTLTDEVAFLIRQGDPDRAVVDMVAALRALKNPAVRQRWREALGRHIGTLTWERLGQAHEAGYV
jgi:glycosyltransferase involved in cell wall biosynthesis